MKTLAPKETVKDLEQAVEAYEHLLQYTEEEIRFRDSTIEALNNVINYFAVENARLRKLYRHN